MSRMRTLVAAALLAAAAALAPTSALAAPPSHSGVSAHPALYEWGG